MATTTYFEETIIDQGGEESLRVEVSRSSFYARSPVPGGTGADSIMLKVEGKSIIMDLSAAKRFVRAVTDLGRYHGLVDD